MEETHVTTKETKDSPSWQDILTGVAQMSQDKSIASEMIQQQARESKAKNIGMVCVTILTSIGIVGLLVVNHLNTREFTRFLAQYDFVSQDGEGYNYYNNNIGGNVANGTMDYEKKEPADS